MPTFTSLEMKTSTGGTVKGKVTLGFGVGAFLGFNFSNHVGIQGEFICNSLSQKYKEVDVERKINLTYVNIPLLLSLNTGKAKVINLNVVAGPQIGYNVGSKLTTSGPADATTTKAVLSVKKGDIGLAYGAGIDFGLNAARTIRVGLGYRGVLGLLDISNNNKSAATDSFYIIDRARMTTHSAYIGASIMF